MSQWQEVGLPGNVYCMCSVSLFGMMDNVHKDIAPVDLTGQVRLARHELGTILAGALKGDDDFCTKRLHACSQA